MKPETPYTTIKLKKFSSEHLLPRLSSDFYLFKEKDPIRMICNFVQILTVTGGRYGETLRVFPTIYVPGAYPWDEVVTQSVQTTNDGGGWMFQDRKLDDKLADDIAQNISKSPMPGTAGISVRSVLEDFPKIARNSVDDRASLYLAFFLMSTDLASADPWMDLAQKLFKRNNKKIEQNWQHLTKDRLEELQFRLALSAPERIAKCRQEAEEHAHLLGLPAINWNLPHS